MAKKTKRKPKKKPAGKAVTIHDPRKAALAAGAPMTFLDFLERASRDPAVDVGKMQQILAMRAAEDAREAERRFDEAMAQAQAAMQHIRADLKNKQTRSRYASYPALDAAVRPIYSRFGFALSFDTADGAPPDTVRVTCDVTCAGHKVHKKIDMPADGKGAKGGDVMSKTHATGSAVTYGMRYLLKMIFNLVVVGTRLDDADDDDGNAASPRAPARDSEPKTITPEQLERLQKIANETATPASRIITYVNTLTGDKITMLDQIPSQYFDAVVKQIEALKRKGT